MTKTEDTPVKLAGNELVLHNAFGTYYEQLEAMEIADKDAEFDMNTKKGMKDYKSYVAKLRRSKAPVKEAAKIAKTEADKLCKAIVSGRDGIIDRVDAIINPHSETITAFESIDKDRVAAIEQKIEGIGNVNLMYPLVATQDSEMIQEWIDNVTAIEIDDSYEEYKSVAEDRKKEVISFLKKQYYEKLGLEETQAKADQVAKENAELKAQNDKLLKDQTDALAKEQARIDAEAKVQTDILKAQAEKIEAEKALAIQTEQARVDEVNRLHQEAQNKLMQGQIEAQQKKEAKEREEQAVIAERQRIEREQQEKAAQEEKENAERLANTEHVAKVEKEIGDYLDRLGVAPVMYKWLIHTIKSGSVPHVTITY